MDPDASLLDLPLAEQVARCVAIKADVVAADEREGDRRMILNYGHTLAHALEAAAFEPDAGLDLRHGEAVAIGLVYAALLARRLGRIDDDRVELHRRVVGAFDLSAAVPDRVEPKRLVSFMARDKKARHDLTFVLDGPRGVEVIHGVDEADVLATLAEMQGPKRRWRQVSTAGSILLLSGPNLNLLGEREPAVYGSATLDEHVATATGAATGSGPDPRALPDQPRGRSGRGGATGPGPGRRHHRQRRCPVPHVVVARTTRWPPSTGVVVELHLSNPAAREPFRHISVIAPVSDGCIAGFGGMGYRLAVEAVHQLLAAGTEAGMSVEAARAWRPWR